MSISTINDHESKQRDSFRAVFTTVVLPGAALLFANLAIYTGMISLTLRPNPDAGIFPKGIAIMGGTLIAGLIYPRFQAWAMRNGQTVRRFLLLPWLLFAFATVAPGLDAYVFNEPLRLVANLALGLLNSTAFMIFIERFPVSWRGTCFGASLAAGLLLWHILFLLARAHPPGHDAAYHPLLATIYTLHWLSIALLTGICLYFTMAGRQCEKDYRPFLQPSPGSSRRSQTVIFYTAALAVYFLSGTVNAKLTPVLPTASLPLMNIWGSLAAIVAAPISGWLLDKWPEKMFRRILTLCCVFFVLTPALAALDYSEPVYTVLQSASAMAQFVFFVICSVTMAGIAPTIGKATLYLCFLYSVRLVSAFGYLLWSRVFHVGQGMSVLVALIVAYAVSRLSWRLDVARAGVSPSLYQGQFATATASEPLPKLVPNEDVTAAFLQLGRLTPRELDAAKLLLKDVTIRNISRVMGIGEGTVKKHAANIYRKYNVTNRHEFSKAWTSYAKANTSPTNQVDTDAETTH